MKKIVLSVVLLTALLVFLTACGVSDSDTPPQHTTTASNTTTDVPEDTTLSNLNIPEMWYLGIERYPDEKFHARFAECAEWMRQYEGTYIRTPLVYSTAINGISLKAEFFKEYYKFGEPIQVRFTLTNNTSKSITYNEYSNPCWLLATAAGIDSIISPMPLNEQQTLIKSGTKTQTQTFGSGETLIIERLFRTPPEYFDIDKCISLIFDLHIKIELTLEICDQNQNAGTGSTAVLPKYKRFTNYAFGKFGTGIPMFIRDTYLTPLAQAVADTADAGEDMYFLVYISDGNTDIDHAGYFDYLYQGKTIQEWNMEREAAIAARAEYENSLSNMTVGQIKLDEKYLQLSDKVDKADEQLSYAQAEWYFHTNKDSIAEHIKYFESFGFESFGDINDTEWQRRLYVANLASTCPIMFAVKGSTDNIEQLRQSNKEYCIILFASTGDGYWVEANDDLSYRPETYNMYYLYNIPEFWKNYIYYSYQELGLYERIWYIEE